MEIREKKLQTTLRNDELYLVFVHYYLEERVDEREIKYFIFCKQK